jgi:hypothetical protein
MNGVAGLTVDMSYPDVRLTECRSYQSFDIGSPGSSLVGIGSAKLDQELIELMLVRVGPGVPRDRNFQHRLHDCDRVSVPDRGIQTVNDLFGELLLAEKEGSLPSTDDRSLRSWQPDASPQQRHEQHPARADLMLRICTNAGVRKADSPP